MNPLALAVITFVVNAVIVVAAGTGLARSGDTIAKRTGLGGAWVGSVLVALATSLPEIATDIAAIRLGAIDLAAGDLFGSSMANMLILALVSLTPAGRPIFRHASPTHALYAALAITMTCIAAAAILVRPRFMVFALGAGSFALLATYLVGSRLAFRISHAGQGNGDAPRPVTAAGTARLRRAITTFVAAALVITVVAPQLARSAQSIAVLSGLGSTFIGTWLMGSSTSLSELATSAAAVRIGAFDLAVGNLLGSNALNMTIFALLDAAYWEAPLLSVVSPVHVLTALVAIALMGVVSAALISPSTTPPGKAQPAALTIIAGYVLGLALVLMQSAG